MFSKHQTSTTLLSFEQGNRATLPLSCSLCAVSTSTPKPRAEGSSPSAPAKNREASTMLASLFFVSAHKDSATRHGCALRSACRGVSERQWRSAANRPRRQPRQVLLPLPKTGGNTVFLPVCFLHVLYGYGVHTGSDIVLLHPVAPACNRSHPLQHPKRTRFRLFGAFSGAFLCFRPFGRAKVSGHFLFTLPHSGYKLKPSVMPCRREVSFLT